MSNPIGSVTVRITIKDNVVVYDDDSLEDVLRRARRECTDSSGDIRAHESNHRHQDDVVGIGADLNQLDELLDE